MHERVTFCDPIGVNDPFSFIRIGSECNTDWGGNRHAHSLPTANERVTANEWFWEVSQNHSLAPNFHWRPVFFHWQMFHWREI